MKKFGFLLSVFAFSLLALIVLSNSASAYYADGYFGYGAEPSSDHYVKESSGSAGYSYVQKDSYDGAQGSVTFYRQTDVPNVGYYRPLFSAYTYRSYGNGLDSYWHDGPNARYSRVESVRTGYDNGVPYTKYYSHTSYNAEPTYYAGQSYYYPPRYNGVYYDHSYNPGYYNCRGYYC